MVVTPPAPTSKTVVVVASSVVVAASVVVGASVVSGGKVVAGVELVKVTTVGEVIDTPMPARTSDGVVVQPATDVSTTW